MHICIASKTVRRHPHTKNPNLRYSYETLVRTADDKLASLSAPVYIVLYGERGTSRRQRLNETVGKRTKGLFRRGAVDEFMLQFPADIGDIKRIRIGHMGV